LIIIYNKFFFLTLIKSLIFNFLIFVSGWALKEFQKNQKQPIKRISPKVRSLLEIMFHTGTVNPNQKMTAENMHEELSERVEYGALEEEEIPKISSIANWITRTYAGWKK